MVDMTDLKNINSIQDKFTSDKVKYNSTRTGEALQKLQAAETLLNTTIPEDIKRITGKESLWKGKSKTEYDELKSFYTRFRKDFNEAVKEYRKAVEGADHLLNNISDAKVLKEIGDA
ncbi:hypothetical protein HB852_06520 [Listeria grandensis]|uniref:WXG100 family type VII secretion target n=1 Tax=Listeria grandensis TaxID=1494963 RepID=A0A7X1CQ44_9LIST|nr:hypothetical protein [Listeria grandensis]MBC1474265.1 hypothetical protein [Listeria grandensis]MBC1936641.1 hypothetical protein [Listeria grandensis]MBC6314288.1 hypothetical protein [Listeria grandensis]